MLHIEYIFLFIIQQLHKLKRAVIELTRAIHLQPDAIHLYIMRYEHRNRVLEITAHLNRPWVPLLFSYLYLTLSLETTSTSHFFISNYMLRQPFPLLYSCTKIYLLRVRFFEIFLDDLLCR